MADATEEPGGTVIILVASHDSATYHYQHPHTWEVALCGTRVRIESTLEDIHAAFERSTIKPRPCARCTRLQETRLHRVSVPRGA